MANLFPAPKYQAFDNNGDPLNGGKVNTYEPGTVTRKATYTTAAGTIANTNPVILNARGEADIWWIGTYKVVVTDADDNVIYSVDNYDNSGFVTYATKAAVKAIDFDSSSAGTKIFITSADGGQFTVRYNATPGTYADDGGSYCGTQFIPTGGDGTIGIVRDYEGARYPEWYGAVGDGTTDDATALNLVFSFGGKVALSGNYLAASQLTTADYTQVAGAGRTQTSIIKGFNGDLLVYGNEPSFSDMTFDGNKATYTGNLLIPSDDGHRHLRFNRVHFIDSAGNGIELQEPAEGLFDDVFFDRCDDYAIKETQGLIGDISRYIRWRACEVRYSKGAVHSVAGSRFCVYDIRIQLCTEHGYRIEAACFSNEYDNAIGGNNGSAFYIDGMNFGQPIIKSRITGNLVSPPGADYTGNPAQIYFTNLTGRQDITLLRAIIRVSAATPDVAIRADSGSVAVVQIGAIIAEEMDNVWLLALQESLLPDLDFTTNMNEALSINFVTGGAEGPYFYDHIKALKQYIGKTINFINGTDSLEPWEQLCKANAGTAAFTLTLPPAADAKGMVFTIIKTDASANAVTVAADGIETINDVASIDLVARYDTIVVFSDGVEYYRGDLAV